MATAPNLVGRRAVVTLPTYNEADNIEPMLEALMELDGIDVAVIDDSSPDGTAEVAARVSARHRERIQVLTRAAKEGLGAAYRYAFAWAIQAGYDIVIQMDADGSHPVNALPQMVELIASGAAQVVVGSRYVSGGATPGWPAKRRALSLAANFYARSITGVAQHDATAGFKAWNAASLARLGFETSQANGYGFQVEMAVAAEAAGLNLIEVPIIFVDRELGASKMSRHILLEGAAKVWQVRRPALRPRRRPELLPSNRPVDRPAPVSVESLVEVAA